MMIPGQSQEKGYDSAYAEFDSPLMQQVRREAYGEDLGQHSWVTADELRSDIERLSLNASSRLLDVGCGPCGPLVVPVRSTGCTGTGVDVSASALVSGKASLALTWRCRRYGGTPGKARHHEDRAANVSKLEFKR